MYIYIHSVSSPNLLVSSTYRVGLHQVGGLCGQTLLLLDVVSHITELLLQHPHSLKVGRVIEGITAEEQELTGRKKGDFVNQDYETNVRFCSDIPQLTLMR